jgi:hypothetical protein
MSQLVDLAIVSVVLAGCGLVVLRRLFARRSLDACTSGCGKCDTAAVPTGTTPLVALRVARRDRVP